MPQMLQRDFYVVVDARVGKAVSWADVPLDDDPEPPEPEKDVRFSGFAVNERFTTTKYVRVTFTLTHIQATLFTELLDKIEIFTYAGIQPPYLTYSSCVIQANTVLNANDQVDYTACLVYPHDAPTGQYVLNIKIYGNYE